MTDRLDELLKHADAKFTRGQAPLDLAQRIPAIARRRKARQFGAIGLLVLGTLLAGMFWPARKPAIPSGPSIAQLRQEAEEYRNASEIHLAAAQRIIAMETAAARPRKFIPDPAQRIEQQRELAALTLLHQADRYLTVLNHPETATAEYRRIIELFPASAPAASARERLKQMNL